MRLLVLLGAWLCGPLLAQHEPAAPASAPASGKHGQQPPPVHDAQPVLPPTVALEHLRAGNARLRAARSAEQPTKPEPAVRPGGAGRWVAAVLVCADAGVDVPTLFGLLPKDVLLLSVPGPFASAEAIAALERAAQNERLSLCVVLTHPGCEALAAEPGASTAAQAASRRAQPARDLAAARRIGLEHAQALLQKEQILSLSESLRQLAREDKFRVVPAAVDPKTLAITWHSTRAEELPIAPVK